MLVNIYTINHKDTLFSRKKNTLSCENCGEWLNYCDLAKR